MLSLNSLKLPLSVPSGCWHVIWCWQWPSVGEKKRKKDKGRRGLTTSWTRSRTIEVANSIWRRGYQRHFRGVCTDVMTAVLSFPLLSSRIIWKLCRDVGNLLLCNGTILWSESMCVRLNCTLLLVFPLLVCCGHSGASSKVGLFVKCLLCDWLKSTPVAALYWFKCLTFFFIGGGTRRRYLASGPVGYERTCHSRFIGCFSFRTAQLKKKLPGEPKEIFTVSGFSQVSNLC